MPEDRKSLREFVNDIAFRKKRAADTRFGHGPAAVEAPREVYEECCSRIAEEFEADGYRYSKSAQHFTRSKGNFRFRVSFQSSRSNVADEFVALWIHGNVLSPTLKKWRRENRALRSEFDFVVGGQIGNLRKDTGWLEWNLADPNQRDQHIKSAIEKIREIIFPYFAVFEDVPTACQAFIDDDFPASWVMDIVDFLQCFGSPGQARQGALNFLTRHADLEGAYGRALDRFTTGGIPDRMLNVHAEALAAASIIYDFGDLRTMKD
jgi:hypothetical protein